MTYDSDELLEFWFGPPPRRVADVQARMKLWFDSDAGMDETIAERYVPLTEAAAAGELDPWADQPRSRLALILALDQLPRNIYRGDALAFAQDARALKLTLDGTSAGMDRKLKALERLFFYMPLQHSEDLETQDASVATYRALMADAGPLEQDALALSFDFAQQHRDLVARFGRFPHRNGPLGRQASAAEEGYLAAGGVTFGQ